jgi:arylsulfatase A-like enzyme
MKEEHMDQSPGGYPGFPGRIGRTREESEPHWEVPKRARAGAPNIVIIFMDDMGWSDIGCYGSEIATPNIDALAANGIRLNHYTTHPICSPARAALLTGRNAHSVATGWLANNNPGFPGYSGEIPLDAPTLAETLRAAGYATAAVGKWHNSPNGATPNQSWPTYRGFERFYGFLEGETGYFFPARIVYNNQVVPIDAYPEGYYATDDWMEKAIGFVTEIRNHDPTRPFFLYVANNAVHGPLQAKEADLAKHRGRYDIGWDRVRAARFERQLAMGLVPQGTRLPDGDPDVPAWDTLPEDQRRLFARYMEAFAAVLDCADQNVGRLLAFLDRIGESDNTIILFSSDNGGTSSAGPTGMVNFNRRFAGLPVTPVAAEVARADWVGSARVPALYPSGWGQACNTPFPSYKTYTGGGGRRVCFIASWPAQLKDFGAIRPQFGHVIDVMPTVLDLAGVAPLDTAVNGKPAQPMQGASLAPVLRDPAAPAPRREQYYECWANRAYYRDGWVAVSLQKRGQKIDFDRWTLHAHAEDFAEGIDLARQHPAKLQELVEAFDTAAWANMVYPLDNRSPTQKFNQLPPHQRPPASARRRFLPGGQTVHRGTIVPLIADRSFKISVAFAHGARDEGVLFAIGDVTGGFVAYIEDGSLHLFYNGFGDFHELAGPPVPAGGRTATFEYEAQGQRRGRGRLMVDAASGDWADLSPTLMTGIHEGLDIGLDRRAPVSWDLYERHGIFRYTGAIRDLVIDSGPFAPDSPFGQE